MGTKWTAERRAKFARTLKAKKAGGAARLKVKATGKTNPAKELRAIGEVLIKLGNVLEPMSPAEAKAALEAVARKFNLRA